MVAIAWGNRGSQKREENRLSRMTGSITTVSFQIFIFASFMITLQSHSMQSYYYIGRFLRTFSATTSTVLDRKTSTRRGESRTTVVMMMMMMMMP
jgi:hypothetical protein